MAVGRSGSIGQGRAQRADAQHDDLLAAGDMPGMQLRVSGRELGVHRRGQLVLVDRGGGRAARSEEHTSELQSRGHLVCRLLLEKKKHNGYIYTTYYASIY